MLSCKLTLLTGCDGGCHVPDPSLSSGSCSGTGVVGVGMGTTGAEVGVAGKGTGVASAGVGAGSGFIASASS